MAVTYEPRSNVRVETMTLHIIDGNNLMYAFRSHGPGPHANRLDVIRAVEQWSQRVRGKAHIVFDGPSPHRATGKLMRSQIVTMQFSGLRTADDLIVDQMYNAPTPADLIIVSNDNAILHEARRRGCTLITSIAFVDVLLGDHQRHRPAQQAPAPPPPEKPDNVTEQELQSWLEAFGYGPSTGSSSTGDKDGRRDDDTPWWGEGVEPLK